MSQNTRPLSPHLFIYKFELTMAMSIVHRITGIGNVLGLLVIAWWLGAAAMGEGSLDLFKMILGNWFGKFIMFCFTWSLFHHMLGGIRHFVWDVGAGYSREARFGFAWATLIGGFVLTVLTFLVLVIW